MHRVIQRHIGIWTSSCVEVDVISWMIEHVRRMPLITFICTCTMGFPRHSILWIEEVPLGTFRCPVSASWGWTSDWFQFYFSSAFWLKMCQGSSRENFNPAFTSLYLCSQTWRLIPLSFKSCLHISFSHQVSSITVLLSSSQRNDEELCAHHWSRHPAWPTTITILTLTGRNWDMWRAVNFLHHSANSRELACLRSPSLFLLFRAEIQDVLGLFLSLTFPDDELHN
jgi:hypothetical protein